MANREIFEQMGVDYEVTLPRFVDSEDFYIKMLKKFLEDDNREKMNECLAESDFENAFAAAHTLKGVSGNLGIGKLNEFIIPLTEELRHPPYDEAAIQDLLQKTNDAYDQIAELIEQLPE